MLFRSAVTCTARPTLRVNLAFVREHCRTDEEVRAAIVHEFLHVLLRHTDRVTAVSPAEHLALDAVINAVIHRTMGPAASRLMSRYYANVEGPFVLLRPQLGENIGSAARAMLNFGLNDLRLVTPRDPWPNERAIASSSGAEAVTSQARVFDSRASALSDLQHVYASSARPRDMQKPILTAAEGGRRLREHALHARTIQIKFRYSDFTTFTRAQSLDHATQLDTEIYQTARALFLRNWQAGRPIRLIGVHTSGFAETEGQLDLIDGERNEKLKRVFSAADALRDKYGEKSVNLAGALRGRFRERVHEAMEHKANEKPKP